MQTFFLFTTKTALVLIVLGFTDTSILVGHFVSSPREKRDRNDSRGDEREEQGERKMNVSEETEEIKTLPLSAARIAGLAEL